MGVRDVPPCMIAECWGQVKADYFLPGTRWAELTLEKGLEEPVVSLGTSSWERRNLALVLGCPEPGGTG